MRGELKLSAILKKDTPEEKLSSLCEDASQMEKLWSKAHGLHYKLLKALYFVAGSSAKDSPISRCYNQGIGRMDW